MPCLEERDLSELANGHILAQRANVQNQRIRLEEIRQESNLLLSKPDADPIQVAEREGAIADLEYHLNGRVNRSLLENEATDLEKTGLNPNRLKRVRDALKGEGELVKDPDLDVAEERIKVMEALYKERSQFVFEDTAHDKDKDGNPIPRYASVFGAPTVKRLKESGEEAIAQDLMLRSISMVMGGEAAKNPNDYLDTTGTEVKKSLSDGIEHHHVYNNVYVDDKGKVKPNSVRFFHNPKTGDIEMQVIPEYWNSEKHGRNTQFIELMDGAHSGDDTVTHLHYYKLDGDDDAFVRQKIKDKIPEIVATNAARLPKLDAELKELSDRRSDPVKYEKKLASDIKGHDVHIAKLDAIEAKYATPNKKGVMVKNKGLSDVEEQELKHARSERDVVRRVKEKASKALEEHRTFVNMEADIKKWETKASRLIALANKIDERKKYPNPTHPLYKNKDEAKAAKKRMMNDAKTLNLDTKNSKDLLSKKGSLDQQIRDKTDDRLEAEKLASLTEEEALNIYERANGFLSFDKGHQESQDYSKSRPRMNAEIHKHNAREATEVLEAEHSENAIKALQEIARKSYQRNLLYNLEPLVNKVAGTLG
jgi:hypothetical protein